MFRKNVFVELIDNYLNLYLQIVIQLMVKNNYFQLENYFQHLIHRLIYTKIYFLLNKNILLKKRNIT